MVPAPAMTPTAATSPTSRLEADGGVNDDAGLLLVAGPRYWVITTLVPMLTKLNRVMADRTPGCPPP